MALQQKVYTRYGINAHMTLLTTKAYIQLQYGMHANFRNYLTYHGINAHSDLETIQPTAI